MIRTKWPRRSEPQPKPADPDEGWIQYTTDADLDMLMGLVDMNRAGVALSPKIESLYLDIKARALDRMRSGTPKVNTNPEQAVPLEVSKPIQPVAEQTEEQADESLRDWIRKQWMRDDI